MRKGNDVDAVKRRSIMLPDSFVAEMAEVRALIGAQSDSEVIRRAFRLYKKLVESNVEVTLTDKETGQQKQLELG